MKLYLAIVALLLSIFLFIESYILLKNYSGNNSIVSKIIICITNVIILLLPVLKIFDIENIVICYFLIYLICISTKILFKPCRRKSIKFTIPIFMFLFFSLLSSSMAYDREIAIKLFIKLVSYVSIIFMIINTYTDYLSRKLLLKSIKLSSIFLIISGFCQLFSGSSDIGLYDVYNPNTNNLRISMTFNDSLEAAVFTTVIIMIIMNELVNKKKNTTIKLFELILIITLIFLLLKTGSRTTMISVIFAITIFYFLFKLQSKEKIKFYMKILLVSPIVLIIFVTSIKYLMKSDILQRFMYIDNSVNVRKEFWNGAIEIYKDNVFGVGLGNFKYYALNYINNTLATFTFGSSQLVTTHAESTYFTFLSEIGLGGVLAYIYILISTLLRGIKNYFYNKNNSNLNFLPILIISVIFIISINNITTYFGNSQAYMTLFFLIIGLSKNEICTENIEYIKLGREQ